MAWVQTQTTFAIDEAIPTTYFDTIGGNLKTLGQGGGRSAIQTATAAAALALPNQLDNVFKVSGTTNIYAIDANGRELGNTIKLMKISGNSNLYDREAAWGGSLPSGYLRIKGTGWGGSYTSFAEDMIYTLTRDEDYWWLTKW